MFDIIKEKFIFDFIAKARWRYLSKGLITTFEVTLAALVLGIVIGTVVAIVRTSHDQNREGNRGLGGFILNFANLICRLYITVIRGTPTLVQLLLMFFVFIPNGSKVFVAMLTFGINSGAYVAEIIRSGIMSIDAGQMEAGRSLGLSYTKAMQKIVMPQAFKNIMPALVNECITLFKETSISGYIGLNELTRGGDIIRGITYDAMLPLLAVAAIYLVFVMFFTVIMSKLERRLRESDIR